MPEEVITASGSYDEGRRQWEAWAMTNWECNERIAGGEQLEEVYRPIPGLRIERPFAVKRFVKGVAYQSDGGNCLQRLREGKEESFVLMF